MSQSLTERYDERIAGMLSCYDRLVITGTLPCYAAGMTGYLNAKARVRGHWAFKAGHGPVNSLIWLDFDWELRRKQLK